MSKPGIAAIVAFLSLGSAPAIASDAAVLTVKFTGAAIGPKAGKSTWDGFGGTVDARVVSAVSTLLTGGADAGATGALVAQTTNLLGSGISAPDVAGYVTCVGATTPELVQVAGTPMALSRKTADSHTPGFNVTYENWPVYDTTAFEVRLWDVDLSAHDDIGTVRVTAADLARALNSGKVLQVPVADQSSGQILAINIAVTAGTPPTQGGQPRMNGQRW